MISRETPTHGLQQSKVEIFLHKCVEHVEVLIKKISIQSVQLRFAQLYVRLLVIIDENFSKIRALTSALQPGKVSAFTVAHPALELAPSDVAVSGIASYYVVKLCYNFQQIIVSLKRVIQVPIVSH